MQPAKTWQHFAIIQQQRGDELGQMLREVGALKGWGNGAKLEALGARFGAWRHAVQDDLAQYFHDHELVMTDEVGAMASRMQLDLTREDDFITFYRAEILATGLRAGTDGEITERATNRAMQLYEKLRAAAPKTDRGISA